MKNYKIDYLKNEFILKALVEHAILLGYKIPKTDLSLLSVNENFPLFIIFEGGCLTASYNSGYSSSCDAISIQDFLKIVPIDKSTIKQRQNLNIKIEGIPDPSCGGKHIKGAIANSIKESLEKYGIYVEEIWGDVEEFYINTDLSWCLQDHGKKFRTNIEIRH
jgi:hypothetical protein